jgi:formiminotetrahydrofolate cyclodeaminase
MPVQINEVIIKTVVDNNMPAGTGSVAAAGSAGSNTSEAALAAMVLEIIKEKKER